VVRRVSSAERRCRAALRLLAGGALLLAAAARGFAEPPARHVAEIGARYSSLSDGLADTRGVHFKALRETTGTTWRAEVVPMERFDDQGTLFAASVVHDLDTRWYASAGAATSAGGFFWPRLRLDAGLHRRWLARQQLVTSVEIGYFDAKDFHSDRFVQLGAAWYFEAPWVLQGGVSVNRSSPGAILSRSGFVAATYGRDRAQFLSLRWGTGRQAYQPFPVQGSRVDVGFDQITGTWRKWIGRDHGFQLVLDWYTSDTYDQRTVEFGVFREF
jgi:YaiO family outer membrane protein